MSIEIRFKPSDNCITQDDVFNAAAEAWKEACADAGPTEEYMREALEDLRNGRPALRWQSCSGFVENVLAGMENRLNALVHERRGEAGFSSYVTDAEIIRTDAA